MVETTSTWFLLKKNIFLLEPDYKTKHGWVSYTFQIAQILAQSHFELVSSVLALEATEPLPEPVSEPVTQMAVELINNHLISVQQKR